MASITAQRGAIRTAFTKVANDLEVELEKDPCDVAVVESMFKKLQTRREKLAEMDGRIEEQLLLNPNTTEAAFSAENEGALKYSDQYSDIEILVLRATKLKEDFQTAEDESTSVQGSKKSYRLPKLEWKKFGGDPKEWLGFWSQFQSVHEDQTIAPQEKFQYLVQATVEKSKARNVVESFPPTAQNYPKVIEYLNERFGKKDVLVEVYTRELLKLVLQKNKSSIASLYDSLETQLRALESLDVKSESTMAILYPLVESALPEELLRLWERKRASLQDEEYDRLASLMLFLRVEVESEARVKIAKDGFGRENRIPTTREKRDVEGVPTANELYSGSGQKMKCIFCGKPGHQSQDCFKAQTLDYEERCKRARERKVCLACLSPGHFSKACKTDLKCQKCGKRHCSLMCKELAKKESPDNRSPESSSCSSTATLVNHSPCDVLLKTIIVKMKGSKGERRVRALIDDGSQESYVTHKAIDVLGFKNVGTVRRAQCLFGGQITQEKPYQVYEVSVESLDGTFEIKFEVLDKPKLCGYVPTLLSIQPKSLLVELQEAGIELSDATADVPDINLLIGADVAGKLLRGETGSTRQLSSGQTAIQTKLGWTLMGRSETIRRSTVANYTTSLQVSTLNVQDLWRLDVLGIADPEETKNREELTAAAQRHFEETVRVNDDGRYEVTLPWVEGHKKVTTNRDLARKRLQSAHKKLVDKKAVESYQKVFDEWKSLGVIERVGVPSKAEAVSYLPHRPIFKPWSGTTPIRPVFDASAKTKGSPSLNDSLEKGPNLIEMLPDILLRFRSRRYGLIADIKKAFLMISIREEDRDFLRFLWWEDGKEVEYRHCRVVFGMTSSPFLLAATLNHHLKKFTEEKSVVEELRKSLYVDNSVASFEDLAELKKFMEVSTRVLAAAKFELRGWEWTTTSELPPLEATKHKIPVLGLLWDLERDEISLDLRAMEVTNDEDERTSMEISGASPLISRGCRLEIGRASGQVTKRGILSAAHKLFDPIGVTCAVTLVPKLLLQELWRTSCNWDEAVPPEVEKKFITWSSDLHKLKNLRFPRWTRKNGGGKESLHVFTDASKVAYAACVFLRVEHEEETTVQLVMAKSRVASTKKMTIPRLELLGCCVGARLAATVKKALEEPDMETMFWTDSSNALYWIKRHENWATFVWNRVEEVRKLSEAESWRHIPGEHNPADLPSRGCSASQLLEMRWWEGPKWLQKSEDQWPKSEVECDLEQVMKEKKKSVVSNLVQSKPIPWYLKYFSSYRKIVRMVAWILRWRKCSEKVKGSLTAQEERDAESKLWKLVQEEVYFDGHSSLKELRAKRDQQGLWRVQTKILERNDTEAFRLPVLLPYNHPLTRMIVATEHKKRNHCGVQVLQNILREELWIPKSRRIIREVVNACGNCRRHLAKSGETDQGPLPVDRVRDTAVFEVIGIDLGGPLYLRSKQKVWFVIFTCAVYRAIHLEVVLTLSTEGFLLALRRFVARRGRPTTIYTDNGTNFEGASNALKALDWDKVVKDTCVEKMKWVFIPPSAPWWGGFWERMVGLTKGLLRRILGRASLELEELSTVLCDVEQIINSRPLTYLSESPEDLIALSPSLFLIEAKGNGVADLDQIDSETLNRRVQYRQSLREALRERFRSEYLGMLVHRCDKKKALKIDIDDIVLVGDDNKKRVDWKLGRVLELFPGRDGVERVARVKTATGEILRPVQRLYPLEMSQEDSISDLTREVESEKTRRGRVVKIPSRYMD